MFLRTVELAFARFQARRDSRALAIVFDRTAPDLLRVARHLASAEAAAEDLVQSTFLRAIEVAGQHRRGDRVLPWLLGLLVNQARAARRRGRRLLDPRRLRGDDAGDPQQEAIDRELGQTLTAAIDRLPEAYRPVLRMSLELGLDANEIARTLERPAGTVRAQQSRGLDLLRRLLPAGVASVAVAVSAGRGLAAVKSHVLGACPGTSLGIGSTLAFGGLLVLHHKLLTLAAAAAVLFGWWALVGEPPASSAAVQANASPSPSPATGAIVVSEPATAGATPAEGESTARIAVQDAGAPAVVATTGELVVELVDENGRPLAGIGVAVQHTDELAALGRDAAWMSTDERGVVRFVNLRPATWHIDLDRMGGIAAGVVVAGQTTHRRVEVPAGVRVEGVVVDARDQAMAFAAVVLHGNRLAAPLVATADAAGRFVVEHMLPKLDLQARVPGRSPSAVQNVGGIPGATVAVTLRVGDAGRRLTGRALTHDGRAMARAKVALIAADAVNVSLWDRDQPQRRPLYLTTDGDGAFATEEAGTERQLLVLQPVASVDAVAWQFVAAGNEPAFVELRAAPAAVLTGRVVGGEAEAGIHVQVMSHAAQPIGFLANLSAVRGASTGADGSYRVEGLLPGKNEVMARRAFVTVAQTELVLEAGQPTTWDIDLAPAAAALPLRVVVRTAAPTERLMVMVGPHVSDNSSPQIVDVDADGVARFSVAATKNVDVSVVQFAGGQSMLQLKKQANLPPGVGEVVFDLLASEMPLRRVRGRLVTSSGAPVANELVAFARLDSSGLIVRVEATTDADGAFASAPVPAGTYRVSTGGPFAMQRELALPVLTIDRDEDLGNVQVSQ